MYSISSKTSQIAAAAQSGFTLIELIVSISIFVFMTAFLVGKYGTFNQIVLATNTAYDVALTIRTAQSYGLNVKQSSDQSFSHPYGVHFSSASGSNNVFYLFSDINGNALLDPSTEVITTSTIKKGLIISSIKAMCGSPTLSTYASADITFKRPDPDAILRTDGNTSTVCQTIQLTITAPDGSTKDVVVRGTGQIAIEN